MGRGPKITGNGPKLSSLARNSIPSQVSIFIFNFYVKRYSNHSLSQKMYSFLVVQFLSFSLLIILIVTFSVLPLPCFLSPSLVYTRCAFSLSAVQSADVVCLHAGVESPFLQLSLNLFKFFFLLLLVLLLLVFLLVLCLHHFIKYYYYIFSFVQFSISILI